MNNEIKTNVFACHCDLNPDEAPDSCVIDIGRIEDCSLALQHRDTPNWKSHCEHWKPVQLISKKS